MTPSPSMCTRDSIRTCGYERYTSEVGLPHPKLQSWVGGPGTGKTHHLITALQNEVDSGVPMEDIRYATFTRAQRDDVIARLRRAYPRKTTVLRRVVKTLHGAALESLNTTQYSIRGNQGIIDEAKNGRYYKEFCDKMRLPYTPAVTVREDSDDESLTHRDLPIGNAVFAISSYIRQHYGWTPADWGKAANAVGVYVLRRLVDPAAVIQAWWDWKAQNNLYEHDDYLHLTIDIAAPAPAPVIIIDEFQDLSPVQYALFQMWLNDPIVKRIYIAGDPNQAIYDFRGANPRFLEDAHRLAHGGQLPDARPQSHRCPVNIVTLADRVLGQQSHMEPAREGGVAERLPARNDREFAQAVADLQKQHGRVMIVCRYTHYMRAVSKTLQGAGVPHTSLTNRLHSWGEVAIPETRAPTDKNGRPMLTTVPMVDLLLALRIVDRHISGGEAGSIPIAAARSLIYLLPVSDWTVSWAISRIKGQKIDVYPVSDLLALLPHRTSAVEIAERLILPPARRDTLVRALMRGGDALPGDVVVDTVHAAKGLEAPVVLVHIGFSQKRRLECARDEAKMEAERRTYYVALTRASEATYLFGIGASVCTPALDGVLSSLGSR
jgi:DNA helicase-2/ATP-dependent DNA helicase PcrA